MAVTVVGTSASLSEPGIPAGDAAPLRHGCGYHDSSYAAAFAEWGRPRRLPTCQGWVLARPISQTDRFDAMGPYPLFTCGNWSRLGQDVLGLADEVVCLAVVTDPFGEYDQDLLRECFPDLHRPFKEHFVIDLGRDPAEFIGAHHRRNIARAIDQVHVEPVPEPSSLLDEWLRLYGVLCDRHGIRGMTAFSRASFERQLAVPGLVALRAVRGAETVGVLLWYVSGQVGYYHLGAYSESGYQLRASFALFWYAIDFLRKAGVSWISLGAGAGMHADAKDGLTRFKGGWSTGSRTAYLCGRIFDHAEYHRLCRLHPTASEGYFPQYRTPVAWRAAQ